MTTLEKFLEVELTMGLPLLRVQISILILLMVATALIAGQRLNQHEIDTLLEQRGTITYDQLQDKEITDLTERLAKLDSNIDAIAKQQAEQKSAIDRIVGIGTGFGTALVVLQAINVLLQKRIAWHITKK